MVIFVINLARSAMQSDITAILHDCGIVLKWFAYSKSFSHQVGAADYHWMVVWSQMDEVCNVKPRSDYAHLQRCICTLVCERRPWNTLGGEGILGAWKSAIADVHCRAKTSSACSAAPCCTCAARWDARNCICIHELTLLRARLQTLSCTARKCSTASAAK